MITEKIPGRVLVFTYRKLNKFFHGIAERTFDGPVTYCSSWPGLEAVNLQHNFYKHYSDDPTNKNLTDDDYHQIITRCSVLRLLPREQSKRMVNAMYKVIDNLTDKARPDYLLTVMVDNYMTDLLARICKKKNARLIMLVGGGLKNTITVTSYGEFNKVREPSEEEVKASLESLLNDKLVITYSLKFNGYSFWTQLRIFTNWWAKCGYFRTRGFLAKDPLNFRYLMGSIPSRDGQSSLWGYKCTRYFDNDWKDKLGKSSLPPVFIPLSYTPEAGVSYWLKDLRYIDYENFILDTAKKLTNSYQVVIKDHWSVLGVRRWPFYEKLKSIPGVVLVPAGENSRLVMRHVERVLVGAGTAGIEAAVRGGKVVTLEKPYYYLEGHYLSLGTANRIEELPTALESFEPLPPTEANQLKIVRRMLQSTLVGHMSPDAFIDTEENLTTTSNSLKAYLAAGAPSSIDDEETREQTACAAYA